MDYPLIFKVACDILPAQASAVPCERVFSSSKETDTHKRNQLSPKMMEMLQILKYRIRSLRFLDELLVSEEDTVKMLDLTPEQVDLMILEGRLHEIVDLIRPSDVQEP